MKPYRAQPPSLSEPFSGRAGFLPDGADFAASFFLGSDFISRVAPFSLASALGRIGRADTSGAGVATASSRFGSPDGAPAFAPPALGAGDGLLLRDGSGCVRRAPGAAPP